MKRTLLLAWLQIVEAVRTRWLPAVCALSLIVCFVYLGVLARDGRLARDAERVFSAVDELVVGFGVWTGFLLAWTHGGSWYDRGVRSGSLVFTVLRPGPRRTVLMGGWLGSLAATAGPVFVGALVFSGVSAFFLVGPTNLWIQVIGVIPGLALWTAAFVVGPLLVSRATTAGIVVLLIFGSAVAPWMAQTLGGGLGNVLLYLQPPVLPVLLSQGPAPDAARAAAEIAYQVCGTVLLLIAGSRRFERMELLERR